uniref:ATP synthase complex subunit 8 n=1 Tax=Ochthebius atriceps TaxID=1309042 RepID=A0A7H0DK57_9COLE|nr:ATP synthase F0 subunit 8 [Ochthebius atriceps]QNP09717.1 ATP synthase F0 subunit 8 [Ochthebius atriceps]
MPQMAPMNWIMLFLMFTMIFLIFNSLNYFSFKYLPLNKSFTNKMNKLNWKW